MMRAVILGLMIVAAPATSAADDRAAAEARAAAAEASGALLQADGPRARALLSALPAEALSTADAAFRACALNRLDPERAPSPPAEDAAFAQKALHAYRLYWRAAVIQPETRDAEEAALAARLSVLLDRPDLTTMAAVDGPMRERIRAEGGFVLGGRTGRLLDLMLWSRQDEREVAVALPEGPHEVKLFLLDDFASRGWSEWLTCGRTGTGGWAKTEGLYAIVPAYDSLEDEAFAVNFLAHETQHFADYAAWAGLPSWQLEYRAKLTEVALAETTRARTLERFVRNQGDDQADAHSYANRRVLEALRRRLALAPDADLAAAAPDALRAAAQAELQADTARRPTPLNAQ